MAIKYVDTNNALEITDSIKKSLEEIEYEINKMFGTKRLMKCDNCFCKYHCAGQCCNNKNAYNDNDYEELCRFTQEMVRRELEYVLGLK